MTSPPAVIDDVVVVGSAIDDNSRVDMPSGVVRAFDARTGALRWSWDPLPPNDAESSARRASRKDWRTGAGNAWSVMAVDPERDLVFVPTGSASPDYYGGLRPGDDKWATPLWRCAARPANSSGDSSWCITISGTMTPPHRRCSPRQHDGQKVPVVIQGNKTGFLYVLNRDTGAPVFPVEERPVPQTDVPGEVTSRPNLFLWRHQLLVPQRLSADDAWGITPEDREACRELLESLRNDGLSRPRVCRARCPCPEMSAA